MREVTPQQAHSIIGIACETWKEILAKKWATQIVLNNVIEIEEDFYKEMRKACTASQHKLFDKIFGTDFDNPYKEGDYICVMSNGANCVSHPKWEISLSGGLIDKITGFDVFEGQVMALTKKGAVLRIQNYPNNFRKATRAEVFKPITPVAGKWYKLEYTGQYCHWYNGKGEIEGGREKLKDCKFQFVGMVYPLPNNPRALFYSTTDGTSYLMMGEKFDYIVEEVK